MIKFYRATDSVTRENKPSLYRMYAELINMELSNQCKDNFYFTVLHYSCRSLCNKFPICKPTFYKVTFKTAEIWEVIKKAIYLLGVAPTYVQTTSDMQATYWSVFITKCQPYIML